MNGIQKNQEKYFESIKDIPDGWEIDKFHRNKIPTPLAEYLSHENVRVIRADEITDAERSAPLGGRGYVWDDD